MKDTSEFKILKNADKLDELSHLLAQSKQEFLNIIDYSSQSQIPEDEWQNMPEFIQEDENIFRQITVKFDSEKDVDTFSKQIDQDISDKTKSIRIPYRPQQKTTHEWSDTS